jgi:CAAX protease family protein
MEKLKRAESTAAYVAPFLVFVGCMALERVFHLPVKLLYPARCLAVLAVLMVSWRVIPWRPSRPLASILLGVAVFASWVAPDILFPGWHAHWLFQNGLTGAAKSSLPAELKCNLPFIMVRVFGSVVLVPVLEELFWRGWLMRWLVYYDFRQVALGAYDARAFWLTAWVFSAEHGPYWDVGLIAGAVYNWWVIRTRNLADCILAHAVTNACLAAYVLAFDQWQYWL